MGNFYGFDPIFLGWLCSCVVLAIIRELTGGDDR